MVILIALERLFLSDLCGREVLSGNGEVIVLFLSDLCGREDGRRNIRKIVLFLSDLCGREEHLLVSSL